MLHLYTSFEGYVWYAPPINSDYNQNYLAPIVCNIRDISHLVLLLTYLLLTKYQLSSRSARLERSAATDGGHPIDHGQPAAARSQEAHRLSDERNHTVARIWRRPKCACIDDGTAAADDDVQWAAATTAPAAAADIGGDQPWCSTALRKLLEYSCVNIEYNRTSCRYSIHLYYTFIQFILAHLA